MITRIRLWLFVWSFNWMVARVHRLARRQGWWDTPRGNGEMIALIHSELSEMLEASRAVGTPKDKHVPELSAFTVEAADAVIRLMDLAGGRLLPLGKAIVLKHKVNEKRPYKHGKKF